ncbi:MAG: PDZ domain-containing protein [Anaerolineaceae bacterium]|nr:PDZ domain-containing protein [Anaerolineaceae bacterium]
MFKNRLSARSVVALLILAVVVSAFGIVGAQDNSAKPFLGVGVTSADKGVKVDQVDAGSPAEKAGIKVDDVITAIDTKAVTPDTIAGVISGHQVGDVITVTLTRGTASMDVKVTLAARPTTIQPPAAATPSRTRPVLGVQIENTDNGPTIRVVAAGSPAEKAGLKVGDVLTKIGDTAVTDAAAASAAVLTHKVGDDVAVEVTRDGKTVTVNVTLAAGSSITTSPAVPANPAVTNRPMLGVSLENSDNGPVVRTVVAGSPAEKAGLKVGDVLTKIGDTEVKDAQSASAAVQTHKIGDNVAIEVTRDGKTVTVNATLAAATIDMNPMPVNPNGMGLTFDGKDKSWTLSALPQDSDLYKAGLREGDKITKFDGNAYDPAGLMAYLVKNSTADVTLTVTRDGKDQDIKVPATALQSFAMGGFGMGFGNEPFLNIPFAAGGSRLGVQFVMLDPSVAKEHNVTETVGALVTQVMPQSPAEKAGLKVNDVVTAVNGDTVNGEHNLRDLLAAHKPGDSVKLDVMRDGKSTQLDVTLDQMPNSGMFQFPGQDGMNGFPFQMPTPEPSSPLTNGSAM